MSNPIALIIKSKSGRKSGKRGVWHEFDQAQPYIQGIETNIDKEIDVETVNTLVSGIPTPWARARLFEQAFKNLNLEANLQRTGLIEFYEIQVNEWKGLMACLAIYPDRIQVSEPIALDMSDETNLFEITSGLGRMLFEDKDVWTNPIAFSKEPDTSPSIQLIYYQNTLIAASSPYSLLFTAAEYPGVIQSDMPWYREGSFVDPLPFLTNDQKQKLYLLLNNIDKNFRDFEMRVNSNRQSKIPIDFTGFKVFLRKWLVEVKNSGHQISDEGTLDAPLDFEGIYQPLFNVKQSVFFDENGFASFYDDPDQPKKEIDPKSILLQEEQILQFFEIDAKQPLKQSAINYLEVFNDPNEQARYLYFPLPLSETGLLLFYNKIGDLLSDAQSFHRLYGEVREEKLKVTLELDISGKIQKYSREYELLPVESTRNIIMWPNFVAQKWSAYYLYTEFPATDNSSHFLPFFKETQGAGTWKPITKTTNDKQKLVIADGTSRDANFCQSLIAFPSIGLDSSFHKYDILRSTQAFGGLEIRKNIDGKERVLGYLTVKNPEDETGKVKDLSMRKELKEVIVGIDFGSNNSCLQYAAPEGSQVKPIPFENRRVFLVGAESMNTDFPTLALPNELYFFQNETVRNGQIKSWVHEHNPNYVISGMGEEEIAGGVAINEANIHIKDMDNRTISTNAGTLHHSMKWLTSRRDNEKKVAYLKAVWIQTCADLYAKGALPSRLKWSYPGSFSPSEQNMHKQNYQAIVSLNPPIKNHNIELDYEPLTESEAVSNYSLIKGSLQPTNLFLGIDIGGSTSDVLIIGMDPGNEAYKLLKQSSVRLAGNYLTTAIKNSNAFQEVLLEFHDNPNSGLRIPNVRTMVEKPNTAPFFLNAIFDQLTESGLQNFYRFIARRNPGIFAVPAYMTGLLLYYSGQLVSKSIKENGYLKDVKKVDLFPFGKGGRIFDWLDVSPGKTEAHKFYNECFSAGLSIMDDEQPAIENESSLAKKQKDIRIQKNEDIQEDNKSEVAIGLVAPNKVKLTEGLSDQSDIFGESGFEFRDGEEWVKLSKDSIIDYKHFQNLDFKLKFPERFEEFEKFLEIFLRFTKRTGIINNTKTIRSKKDEIYNVLKGYITNDREYLRAKANLDEGFEFKHSMLILEGMCFLEKFLIPEIYR
ncbi:MAG: hypothetical protein GY705_24305 [Bacteroidetes bacterium]|nr:hypothetical protein [Bacteroidota bacterium]